MVSKCAAWDPQWSNGSDSDSTLTKYCHKYVNVFGVNLCVTKKSWDASEAKAVYVANVIAQYMDNNEDGQVDDPNVAAHIASKNTLFLYQNYGYDTIFSAEIPWIMAGA